MDRSPPSTLKNPANHKARQTRTLHNLPRPHDVYRPPVHQPSFQILGKDVRELEQVSASGRHMKPQGFSPNRWESWSRPSAEWDGNGIGAKIHRTSSVSMKAWKRQSVPASILTAPQSTIATRLSTKRLGRLIADWPCFRPIASFHAPGLSPFRSRVVDSRSEAVDAPSTFTSAFHLRRNDQMVQSPLDHPDGDLQSDLVMDGRNGGVGVALQII